jgi:hypothetical protein
MDWMSRFTILVFACIAAMLAGSPAMSAGADLKKAGITVVEKEAVHSKSLQAFKEAQKGVLGQYDFYYQLKIDANLKPTLKNCSTDPASFFEKLFGKEEFVTVVATFDPRLRPTSDIDASLAKVDNLPVLFVGYDADSKGEKKGCFFQQAPSSTVPALRYNSFQPEKGKDEFPIKIIAEKNQKTEYKIVETITETFSALYKAWSWSFSSPEKIAAIGGIATKFEQAFNSMGTGAGRNTREYFLRAAPIPGGTTGGIDVTTDLVGNVGQFKMYVYATASLFFDQVPNTVVKLTPLAVLDSNQLMSRKCAKEILKQTPCAASNDTVLEGLQTIMPDKEKEKAAFLFDLATTEGRKAVRGTCQKLRNYASSSLQLPYLSGGPLYSTSV